MVCSYIEIIIIKFVQLYLLAYSYIEIIIIDFEFVLWGLLIRLYIEIIVIKFEVSSRNTMVKCDQHC
jgi:hypothetical protein